MSLFEKLQACEEAGRPIAAGKFETVFLSQMLRVPGIHLIGVVDPLPAQAKSNMAFVDWLEERYAAASLDERRRNPEEPMSTSRPWPAIWWTGPAPAASRW